MMILICSPLTRSAEFSFADVQLIGLYPVDTVVPADKEFTWMFFIYESEWLQGERDEVVEIYPQALRLRNWETMWFVLDREKQSHHLTGNYRAQPGEKFKLQCYLRYQGVLYDERRVVWYEKNNYSYQMKYCMLSEEQLEACRPEVLLVPSKGVNIPVVKPKPSFLSRMLGVEAGARIVSGTTSKPANVVMLMIDTLRRDHTPPGGHPFVIAPHIDMISTLGVHFENSYGASSSTRPSIGSLFTGLHPKAHGAERHAIEGARLLTGVPRLAERFKNSGFHTAGISSNAQITDDFGFNQGFDIYECPVREHQVTKRGLHWLQQLNEPFFLYLHFIAPHQPYEPPDVYAGMYQGQSDKTEQDLYLAEITAEDRSIGKIIAELSRQGLLDRTLVWVLSDHGEEFWEHGWNGHGANLYEESVQTLSAVMYPRLFGIWKSPAEPVTHSDVFPTLKGIFGWGDDLVQQGKSLLPLFTDSPEEQKEQDPRPLFLHHGGGLEAGAHESDKQAVLKYPYKLVWWTERDEWELYSLEQDPKEQDNIIEELPEVRKELEVLLKSQLELSRGLSEHYITPDDGNPITLSESELENMRALGYIK